jgi:hypothetical protein
MEELEMSGARGIAARSAGAGLLVGLALSWALGAGRSPQARATPAPVEANGTFAFTSGGPGPAQWLYLIDTKNQAMAVYSVNATPQNAKGALKLEAVRQYRWDLKLAEYNNQPPEVAAIESMVGGPKR